MSARKKVRPGAIQLSENGTALEVHYESQDIAVLPDGQERVQGSRAGVKRLPILFSAERDVAQVAQQLVAGCKLIHPSRTADVEALVQQAWAQRTQEAPAAPPTSSGRGAGAGPAPPPPQHSQHPYGDSDRRALLHHQQHCLQSAATTPPALDASMERLESYLAALYEEDMGAKVAATARIARLFEAHLPQLVAHPTLLPALARLLREDYRKSSELCLNLLTAFLLVSHQPACRPLLVQNQVGSVSMDVVELELRRAEHWQVQEGVGVVEVCARLRGGERLGEREGRLAAALARQEVLLFAALHLLLNMAEEPGVEGKMVRRGLVGHLVALLDRAAPDLLVLAATFLRKLAVYAEHRAALLEAGAVPRLAVLLPCGDGALLRAALRLLHNLSFEGSARTAMAAAGLVPKAVGLLAGGEPARALALGLLYHLSLDDRHRSMFLYADALPVLHALLMDAPADALSVAAPELVALLGCLAKSGRVAEEMARGGCVGPLLERALQGRDEGLWHVARALSRHDSEAVRACFVPSLPALVALMMDPATSPTLATELLGTLANLDVRGYDYLTLLQSTNLCPWLLARLQAPGGPAEDAVLAVAATGTVCTEATAGLLAEAGLVEALHDVMLQRLEEEHEFVLQATVTAHRLLLHAPTRDALLRRPELAARFAELLEHPSREVCRAADAALDCVAALSAEWAASVRRLRFEAHNRLWIEVVRGSPTAAEAGDAAGGDGGAMCAPLDDGLGTLREIGSLGSAGDWAAAPAPVAVA